MESKYFVKEFSDSEKSPWNEFIGDSQWGDILQFWQWGEVKRLEGWKPLRVGVVTEDKPWLLAQCLVKETPLLGKVIYIPHGPIFIDKQSLAQTLPLLVEFLRRWGKENGAFVIEIEPKLGEPVDVRPLPLALQHFTDKQIKREFAMNGFKKSGRNMQPVYKLYYDLSSSEEQLMSLMKKNTRYNVRLAERKGVVFREYFPDDLQITEKLKNFYTLLEEMQQRAGGYPIRPYASFVELFAQFKGSKNIVLSEVSYKNDVIAYNISERAGYWASSFYASSNRKHPEVKAPYLLRWKSIQSAIKYGCKIYDFWGIIPGSEQHKGYSDTKISFGGFRIDNEGILALPLNSRKYLIWNKLLPLRSKVFSLVRKLK